MIEACDCVPPGSSPQFVLSRKYAHGLPVLCTERKECYKLYKRTVHHAHTLARTSSVSSCTSLSDNPFSFLKLIFGGSMGYEGGRLSSERNFYVCKSYKYLFLIVWLGETYETIIMTDEKFSSGNPGCGTNVILKRFDFFLGLSCSKASYDGGVVRHST